MRRSYEVRVYGAKHNPNMVVHPDACPALARPWKSGDTCGAFCQTWDEAVGFMHRAAYDCKASASVKRPGEDRWYHMDHADILIAAESLMVRFAERVATGLVDFPDQGWPF